MNSNLIIYLGVGVFIGMLLVTTLKASNVEEVDYVVGNVVLSSTVKSTLSSEYSNDVEKAFCLRGEMVEGEIVVKDIELLEGVQGENFVCPEVEECMNYYNYVGLLHTHKGSYCLPSIQDWISWGKLSVERIGLYGIKCSNDVIFYTTETVGCA